MPAIEKHIELSLKRTGKEYREVHEWMEGNGISYNEKSARHDIANIAKFLPVVEKQFGTDAVHEYLQHIKDDYENHILLKAISKVKSWLL